MAQGIDLSVPWVAMAGNNRLAPFTEYERAVEDEETPSASQTPVWSKKAHAAQLSSVSGSEGPLWDSVLALYRLQLVESRGPVWKDHVAAWLVRPCCA